jgi:transcriptional regulator with XRE-family HTH domain
MPGSIIKQLREEKKITRTAMAELLFMSQSNYSKIENNQVALTAEVCKRIVKILGVNLEDVLPDDSILENSLLFKERQFEYDTIVLKMEEILAQNLHEFKCWMQEKLDKKEGASVDNQL